MNFKELKVKLNYCIKNSWAVAFKRLAVVLSTIFPPGTFILKLACIEIFRLISKLELKYRFSNFLQGCVKMDLL